MSTTANTAQLVEDAKARLDRGHTFDAASAALRDSLRPAEVWLRDSLAGLCNEHGVRASGALAVLENSMSGDPTPLTGLRAEVAGLLRAAGFGPARVAAAAEEWTAAYAMATTRWRASPSEAGS